MNDLDDATDECLLERTRRGDATAFQKLYDRHRDTTFRFACLLLGSSEHAEDVTHDCFLGLIRNPGRFDPRRAALRTYLYAAARNLVLKRLRRPGNESPYGNPRNQESPDRSKEPLQSLLDREMVDDVRKALAQLPHPQREAIVLFEYEEQSLADIAAITGAPVSTIKWRLHQARESLRRELAPYLNGGAEKRQEKSNHA